MKVRLLVFPYDLTPYQQMLYTNMHGIAEILYVGKISRSASLNSLLFPLELFFYRLRGFSTLHLHWLYPFHISSSNKFFQQISETELKLFIWYLKLLKIKVVWTVHNWMPHEKTFPDDLEIAKYLTKNADRIIVMNRSDQSSILKLNELPHEKIVFIPHGNFIDVYKKSDIATRTDRGVQFLFFGNIKPYKGLENLLESFCLIKDLNVSLRIVGQCSDKRLLDFINSKISMDKRMSFINSYIPDNEVADQFTQCDIVVLPFEKISNSGSALLAFSMGKPIIAPLIGAIKDFPSDTGIYFDPVVKNSLLNALQLALEERESLQSKGSQAYSYAKTLDWKNISAQTVELYRSLI